VAYQKCLKLSDLLYGKTFHDDLTFCGVRHEAATPTCCQVSLAPRCAPSVLILVVWKFFDLEPPSVKITDPRGSEPMWTIELRSGETTLDTGDPGRLVQYQDSGSYLNEDLYHVVHE
jgi:hypothetical protein